MSFDDNTTTYEIDIPGVKKEDVDILVEDRILQIKTIRNNKEKLLTIQLTKQYDLETIDALIENGVLYITLKRKEKKKIEIKVR